MDYDVFAIYLDDEPSKWMLECISKLEGPVFRLKVRHRKRDIHRSNKRDFDYNSIIKSSKILIFISSAFFDNINRWDNHYEILIKSRKEKKDVMYTICDNAEDSALPEYLRQCECIKNGNFFYENLYRKLVT